jgi:mycothiol system anti-sigma-R factor
VGCELTHTVLHGYMDGELDAARAADFERHLISCADCVAVLEANESVRSSIQRAGLYERAPRALRQKIQAQLAGNTQASVMPFRKPTQWRWLALAAAILVALFLGWRLPWLLPGNQETALASAIVDAHLRSLQPGHLEDVVSTDQHTVKPWFDGKLNFAPPVRDFTNDGFPLIGGRLDVIDGRTVAALVYGRRKHVVNVFVAKAQPDELWSGSGDIQGYHWSAWQNGTFAFCAVSDAAPPDLDQLKQLFAAP